MDIFAPEEAPPDAKEAPVDALIICIERIEALIESENTLLRNCSPFDLERSDLRKARALIELARMSESLPSELSPAAAERLRSFQSKQGERRVLEHHLRATIDIAELLVAAIRREQSDGTYSQNAALAGR